MIIVLFKYGGGLAVFGAIVGWALVSMGVVKDVSETTAAFWGAVAGCVAGFIIGFIIGFNSV